MSPARAVMFGVSATYQFSLRSPGLRWTPRQIGQDPVRPNIWADAAAIRFMRAAQPIPRTQQLQPFV
jgi:hypothetical protein